MKVGGERWRIFQIEVQGGLRLHEDAKIGMVTKKNNVKQADNGNTLFLKMSPR